MSTYDWLLFFHVLGAFLLLSGAVAIGTFQIGALRHDRPSEIALLLNLGRVAEVGVDVGALLVLVLGIWLAEHVGYGVGDEWVVGSIALWALSVALGALGGIRAKRGRLEAERLAQEEDQPTPQLRALVRDPVAQALNWGSGAAVVAILVLMVWKPGAG